MLIDDFKAWLESEGYRPGTVRKTAVDLSSYLRNPSLAQKPSSLQRARDYFRAWLLWEEYRESAGVGPIEGVTPPPAPQKPRRRIQRQKRKLAAQSIEEEEWVRLKAAAEADGSMAAHVILVIMGTGLRIGDVLRVPFDTLSHAIEQDAAGKTATLRLTVKRGKEVLYPLVPAWRGLWSAWTAGGNVAAAACASRNPNPEAHGPANKAVSRKLKELGNTAGVVGRLHLHRLRRSVATILLKRGARLEEVQKVLGHSNVQTTQGYVDEQMADMVSKTLERLDEAKETR